LRPSGGPIIYVVLFFAVVFWFVASLQIRKASQWAWWASLAIAGLLLALFAYRVAQGILTGVQILLPVILLLVDLSLLVFGRRELR
jgi:uncharacterized membrane protein